MILKTDGLVVMKFKKKFFRIGICLAPLLAGAALPGRALEKTSVQVKGSDTMVYLVSAWAEKFMQQHPEIEISVTGGGSADGVAGLIHGSADIASVSRPLEAAEENAAKSKGMRLVRHPAAKDAVAVVVNPANPVQQVSLKDLKGLFTGEIDSWKALGGSERGIVLYLRGSSSGTSAFFQERILGKRDYAPRARRLASTAAVAAAVAGDPGGIGTIGLGVLREAGPTIRPLGLSAAVFWQSGKVNPAYPLARDLDLVTNGEARGDTRLFLEFVHSRDGQNLAEECGFLRIQ